MRVGLTVEWALELRDKIIEIVRARLPELEPRWPLQGVAYDAFATDDWLLLVVTPVSERAMTAGPRNPLPLPPEDLPLPTTPGEFHEWDANYRERHALRTQDLLALVPAPRDAREEHGLNLREQWDTWTEEQRALWEEALSHGFFQGLSALLHESPRARSKAHEEAIPVAARAYKPHPSFDAPADPDQPLWRYMSLAKYLSLLSTRSLFFTRAERLGDPWEGALGPANVGAAAELYGELAPRLAAAGERLPMSVFVSCWHAQDWESAAMWAVYAGVDPSRSDGVALRSTFRRLLESLEGSHDVYCGTVHYVDYDAEFIPEDNMFERFMRKRRSFEHEQEVRAVIALETSEVDGIRVDCDLETLIEEVRVAPSSPDWFRQVTIEVTAREGLSRPVLQSRLDDPPVR
jgi:hypothetical protein